MRKNLNVTIHVTIYLLLAFILLLLALRKDDFDESIKMGNLQELEYTTEIISNKVLVPEGEVRTPNEVEVLIVTYKVTKKYSLKNKILDNDVISVVDQDGNSLINYLIITIPDKTQIRKSTYLTYEIRLKRPTSQEEYDMIASKRLIMTLWLTIE